MPFRVDRKDFFLKKRYNNFLTFSSSEFFGIDSDSFKYCIKISIMITEFWTSS